MSKKYLSRFDEVSKKICKASRPIVYAGHGCTFYKNSLVWFTEHFHIPVMVSWRAIDLVPDAPRPGMFNTIANKVLDEADLVLVLGARLDDTLTGYDLANFATNAVKIVVDIDQAELDRLPEDYIKINMDVGDFLRRINELRT